MNIVTQADWDRLGKLWRTMTHESWSSYRCKVPFYRELEHQQEIEDTLAKIAGLEHAIVLQRAKLKELKC